MKPQNRRTMKLLQQRHCPECTGTAFIIDHQTGELSCTVCGLVLVKENLDTSPEWGAYSPAEKQLRSRTGLPITLRHSAMGFATTFLPHHDYGGKLLSSDARQKMQRLQRWHRRMQMHSSRDRNLQLAMAELSRLADHLNIPPHVTENAAFIYRKALHNKLVRGRSIHAITAASLYLACRAMMLPRKLTMFGDSSSRTIKEISRCYRLIHRTLKIEIPIDKPEKYISRIASKARLNQAVQNKAIEMIHAAQQRHAVVGKSPVAIAAAALYIAARREASPITQKAIAAAADVTEVTIRNRYQDLARVLNIDLSR